MADQDRDCSSRPPLSVRTGLNLRADTRFNWEAPRIDKCAECQGRHEGDLSCAEFAQAQTARLKGNDMAAFFWHMGYRLVTSDALYDTGPLSTDTIDTQAPIFKSFKKLKFGEKPNG